ncbi:MAG: hypothetical protein L0177_04370 [Chloroflexi bacterium]|nr:hypothetical protein [Chloroflexota bacterium]
MSPIIRAIASAALALAALIVLAACGGDSETPAQTVEETLAMAPASSDLSVGENRVVFALLGDEGPVRDAEADVQVSTFFLSSGAREGPIETAPATFRQWPSGPGGVYVTRLSFDRAGTWGLAAIVRRADGSAEAASISLQVKERSDTPALGSPAPRSDSKTARDVTSLDQLTTDTSPDPDMYAMSIAEALDARKPLMVTFSTPAFCQTATCGPQLDVVKQLKDEYREQASFIHVEVYDNPHEIQGDLANAVVSPTIAEWGLPSEPWTFIVGADGLIKAKFEAFTTADELEEALSEVLAN